VQKSWPDEYTLSERIFKSILAYKFAIIVFSTFTGGILLVAYFTSWIIAQIFFPTFAGVYLSFLLQNSLQRLKARKAAKHVLSAIWLELGHNEKIIEDIKNNFDFPLKDIDVLPSITRKISDLQILASKLEDKSFYAGQQSRAFFEVPSDKVYNAVQTAYYNLKSMQEMLLAAKLSFLQFILEILSVQKEERDILKKQIEESIKEHLSKCEKEIKISLRRVRRALDELADTLKEKYGVLCTKELRDTELFGRDENKKNTKI